MSETAISENVTYEQLGRRLRDARLARKLDLAAIAQKLHIRVHYLEALEEGTLSILPGDTFVSGYIGRYAWFLGLPADEITEEYRHLGALPTRQLFYIPQSINKEQQPGWRLVALTLSMAFVLITAWSAGQHRGGNVYLAQVPLPQLHKEEPAPRPRRASHAMQTIAPRCAEPDAPAWPPCYYTMPPLLAKVLLPREPLRTIMELAK